MLRLSHPPGPRPCKPPAALHSARAFLRRPERSKILSTWVAYALASMPFAGNPKLFQASAGEYQWEQFHQAQAAAREAQTALNLAIQALIEAPSENKALRGAVRERHREFDTAIARSLEMARRISDDKYVQIWIDFSSGLKEKAALDVAEAFRKEPPKATAAAGANALWYYIARLRGRTHEEACALDCSVLAWKFRCLWRWRVASDLWRKQCFRIRRMPRRWPPAWEWRWL